MTTAGWSGPESEPDTIEVESRPTGGGVSSGERTVGSPRLGVREVAAGRMGGTRMVGGWSAPRSMSGFVAEAGRRGDGTGMVGVGGTGSPGRTGDATADHSPGPTGTIVAVLGAG